jgi:hypothetical protein
MTGAMVVVGSGTPLQPLVAMLIQMFLLLLVLKMAPYNDDLDDWSSFICSLALTLTTLAGFLLMVKSASASTDNGDIVVPEIITHFLIISNALVFVYEILVIGYVGYQVRLHHKKFMLEFKRAGSHVNMALTTIGHHGGGGHDHTKKKNSNKVQVLPINDVFDDDNEKETKKIQKEKDDNDNDDDDDIKSWGTKPESKNVSVSATCTSRKKLGNIKKQFGPHSEEYKTALQEMGKRRKTTLNGQNVSTVVGTNGSLAITVMMLVGSFVVGVAEGTSEVYN